MQIDCQMAVLSNLASSSPSDDIQQGVGEEASAARVRPASGYDDDDHDDDEKKKAGNIRSCWLMLVVVVPPPNRDGTRRAHA